MLSLVSLVLFLLSVLYCYNNYRALTRHIEAAKLSGLKYVVLP